MNEKRLETLKNFISSNNSFYNALKSQEEITIDIYIKFELILLYLKINKRYLQELSTEEYETIMSFLSSNDFIIEGSNIINNGTFFSIEQFIAFVEQVEELKKHKSQSKVIHFIPKKDSSMKPKRRYSSKVIELKHHNIQEFYTLKEQSFIFANTARLDELTSSYVNKTNNDFVNLLNDIILNILNGCVNSIYKKYLCLLCSYLNLFPFLAYFSEEDIPYEILDIPQNEISLSKSTYDNNEITSLESKMINLDSIRMNLAKQKRYFSESKSVSSRVKEKLAKQINFIDDERAALLVKHYFERHKPEVYNYNLLHYILKSFEQGNVEINELFSNPIIKLFYIEHRNVEFHCTMHLKTLVNLIDNERLLDAINPPKQLKKTN